MTPELIWFLAGLVLILLEFTTPGIVLIFFGLGAWVTSLTTALGWSSTLAQQMSWFGISSLALLIGLRRLFQDWLVGRNMGGDAEAAVEEYLGKTAKALTDIPAGSVGKVEFKGAHWGAEALTDILAGDAVIITARDGIKLKVSRK